MKHGTQELVRCGKWRGGGPPAYTECRRASRPLTERACVKWSWQRPFLARRAAYRRLSPSAFPHESRTMMVATFESTELLIKYVREHRILYDPQYPGYKNGRKEHVWEEIGRRLNISGEEAKKKWRNLRDTHTKYLKSRNIPAPPGRKNYKSWQWAVQMDFFKPFLTSNESLRYEPDLMLDNSDMQFEANGNLSNSSMGDLQNMYDSFNFEVSQPTSTIDAIDGDPLNLFSAKRKRSCEDSNEVTEPDCSEEAENKWGTSDFDAMEHIFLGYAKIVKSFSPRRQAEAKMKVAQVIMQQEIEHFEEMAVDSKT